MSMKRVRYEKMNGGQSLPDVSFPSFITEGNSRSLVMFMIVLEENKQGEEFFKILMLRYFHFH